MEEEEEEKRLSSYEEISIFHDILAGYSPDLIRNSVGRGEKRKREREKRRQVRVKRIAALIARNSRAFLSRYVYSSGCERPGLAINQSRDRDINLSNDRARLATGESNLGLDRYPSLGGEQKKKEKKKEKRKKKMLEERRNCRLFPLGLRKLEFRSFFLYLLPLLLGKLASTSLTFEIFDVRKFDLNASEIPSCRVNLSLLSLDGSKL